MCNKDINIVVGISEDQDQINAMKHNSSTLIDSDVSRQFGGSTAKKSSVG
jgi:hypothetical protein